MVTLSCLGFCLYLLDSQEHYRFRGLLNTKENGLEEEFTWSRLRGCVHPDHSTVVQGGVTMVLLCISSAESTGGPAARRAAEIRMDYRSMPFCAPGVL